MALSRRTFFKTTLAGIPLTAYASEPDQNWQGFRGPGARGVAHGYPTRAVWNADKATGKISGVLWRSAVPGLGHASPVVWGDRIFISTAVRLSGNASLQIGYDKSDIKAAKDNDD